MTFSQHNSTPDEFDIWFDEELGSSEFDPEDDECDYENMRDPYEEI